VYMICKQHSAQSCGGWTKSAHLMQFSTKPAGPVIISPDGLLPSLYRELVLRRPHEFKIRCRLITPGRQMAEMEWRRLQSKSTAQSLPDV
jgi:hypothetical protein